MPDDLKAQLGEAAVVSTGSKAVDLKTIPVEEKCEMTFAMARCSSETREAGVLPRVLRVHPSAEQERASRARWRR